MDLSKATTKLFVAKVLNAVVVFVGLAYFAQTLGASRLGVFFIFEMLVGVFSIITDFGLRGAIEKRLSEHRNPGELFGSVLAVKGLLVVCVSGVILAGGPLINAYAREPIAILLVVGLACREAALLLVRVISGELRVGETAVLRVVQRVVWMAVGAILVAEGLGTRGLILGYISGFVAMFMLGLLKFETPIRQPTLRATRRLFRFSKFHFLTQAGAYVYSWMDIALIGFFLTSAAVGAYEIAWRVSLLVTLLSSSIGLTIFPQMSRWDAEDAIERIESLIPTALTPSLVLVIPAFAGSLLLSREILTFVFSEGFAGAAVALVILMFQRIFQSIHIIVRRALEGIDKPDLVAKATVVTIGLNFVLNVALIPRFGIVGAAIATGVAYTCNTVFHVYYLSQYLTVTVNRDEIGWIGGAAGVMLVALRITLEHVAVSGIGVLVAVIGFGALVYFASLGAYPPLRRKLLAQFRTVIRGGAT